MQKAANMKALSKPLSSPSRGDKFPPPLMRFLRSNAGSRSRGRSRSSPMFYLRSRRRIPAAVESTQEPSSPKVTCIGQVRVRRSAKSKAGKPAAKRRRCWWLKKSLFCGGIASIQKRLFCNCKCGSFFSCRKVDGREDSIRVYSDRKGENIIGGGNGRISCSNDSESDYRGGSQEDKRDFIESSSSSSPPKNALILTRCRSAPYRSSSLAGRFWGSPLAEEEDSGKRKSEELQKPICENAEDIDDEEEEGRISEDNSVQELKATAVHPLLLTRCKSEPARRGERLVAEAIFSRQTRLDGVQPRSQRSP